MRILCFLTMLWTALPLSQAQTAAPAATACHLGVLVSEEPEVAYPNPFDELGKGSILIHWQEAEGVERYRLEISRTEDFKVKRAFAVKNAQMSLVLYYNQAYYWRVRAFAANKEILSCWPKKPYRLYLNSDEFVDAPQTDLETAAELDIKSPNNKNYLKRKGILLGAATGAVALSTAPTSPPSSVENSLAEATKDVTASESNAIKNIDAATPPPAAEVTIKPAEIPVEKSAETSAVVMSKTTEDGEVEAAATEEASDVSVKSKKKTAKTKLKPPRRTARIWVSTELGYMKFDQAHDGLGTIGSSGLLLPSTGLSFQTKDYGSVSYKVYASQVLGKFSVNSDTVTLLDNEFQWFTYGAAAYFNTGYTHKKNYLLQMSPYFGYEFVKTPYFTPLSPTAFTVKDVGIHNLSLGMRFEFIKDKQTTYHLFGAYSYPFMEKGSGLSDTKVGTAMVLAFGTGMTYVTPGNISVGGGIKGSYRSMKETFSSSDFNRSTGTRRFFFAAFELNVGYVF